MGLKEWWKDKKERKAFKDQMMKEAEREALEEMKDELKDEIKKVQKARIKKEYADKSKPLGEKVKDIGDKLGKGFGIGDSEQFNKKMNRMLGNNEKKEDNEFEKKLKRML